MNTDFEQIVKRISPTLKRIAYKLGGHSSFFNDEDLFQEAITRLWQDFLAGKLDDKTDSYLLQGCYFHLKNYLRIAKDKAKLISLNTFFSGNDEEANLDETLYLGSTESHFDEVNSSLLVEDIMNDGLTKREKQVFSLCLEGLTVREMALRLSISHVRVIKIEKNMRRKLKKFLD